MGKVGYCGNQACQLGNLAFADHFIFRIPRAIEAEGSIFVKTKPREFPGSDKELSLPPYNRSCSMIPAYATPLAPTTHPPGSGLSPP